MSERTTVTYPREFFHGGEHFDMNSHLRFVPTCPVCGEPMKINGGGVGVHHVSWEYDCPRCERSFYIEGRIDHDE